MKTLFKPARILFYILMLLTFCMLGFYYASFVDAGKGQGLAGGAIVLGYGLLFGSVAFVASFFIAHCLEISKIKIINWILLVLLGVSWAFKYYELKTRNAQQEEQNKPYQNTNPTETTEAVSANKVLYVKEKDAITSNSETPSAGNTFGIGFFKPILF